jgi:hypothetical protein
MSNGTKGFLIGVAVGYAVCVFMSKNRAAS